MRNEDALLVSEGRTAVKNGRLAAVLQERELKQADLALVLGVTEAAISRWAAGLRTPDRANAIRLARFLRALSLQRPSEVANGKP
jgi:predicted transcriptional regulator